MIQMTRHYSRWAPPPSLPPWSSPCSPLFTFSVDDDDDETMKLIIDHKWSGPPSSKNSASPFALSGGLIFYSPLKSSNINHRASSPCE